MISLRVKGMTCDHCEAAVRKALGAVPGVTRVLDVNRERNEVRVEGSPALRDLVRAIREQGYTVEMDDE